jgi:hypothetical protein
MLKIFNLIILPQWVTGFLAAEARPTSGELVLEAVIGDGWGDGWPNSCARKAR